jgi:hypothetical protein
MCQNKNHKFKIKKMENKFYTIKKKNKSKKK